MADPSLPNAWQRLLNKLLQRSFFRWIGMNLVYRVDPYLLRWSSGRLSVTGLMGVRQETALIQTIGARSGQQRAIALWIFHDGDDLILIASNFGRKGHPAWYSNLRAHPDVMVMLHGIERPYRAREVSGDEYDALWAKVVAFWAGYANYKRLAAPRQIPLIVLQSDGIKRGPAVS